MDEIGHLPEAEVNLNKTVGQVLRIIAKRRWWITLPTVVTTFATLFVLTLVPNRYSSEATLLVVQQQVPERYVLPTTTTNIREALQATTEEVLSRTRLQGIIDEFGLYSKERKRASPEALLELMRRDIVIEPLESVSVSDRKDVSSFKITFVASTPLLAQEVTSKLTSLFIEQNLETREHQASTTTNFLREQLDAAKAKLAESEDQVRAFKMQHLGELPEQQPGNLAIMAGLQSQLQSTMASLSRAEEQRQYLESLSEYRTLTIANDLTHLKAERAKLLDRYTPQYPAVVKLDEKIAQTEAALNSLQVSRTNGTQTAKVDSSTSSIAPDGDISLGQLRGQLQANRLEIENLSKDEKRLKQEVDQYQTRLNATPVREQQLAGILRNYEQLKQDYTELLAKESQSQMAADLEKRQEGQQFRLVDRPSLPTVPSSPNRIKVSLGGAAAGLGLGLALAFLVNMMDRSFHSEEDLSQAFAVPMVIGVPILLTLSEERSRSRKKAFEWVAGSGLVLAALVAQLYEFYLYRHG